MIFFSETLVSFERKHFVTSPAGLFAANVGNLKSFFFLYLKVLVSLEASISPANVKEQGGAWDTAPGCHRPQTSGRTDLAWEVWIRGQYSE